MTDNTNEYRNLTELLLGPIRKRPAMFLGDNKISSLSKFITGYSFGFDAAKTSDKEFDNYFGEFGFIEWFLREQNLQRTSFWETPFLDKAHSDEQKALQIYFDYLEKYNQQRKKTNGCN